MSDQRETKQIVDESFEDKASSTPKSKAAAESVEFVTGCKIDDIEALRYFTNERLKFKQPCNGTSYENKIFQLNRFLVKNAFRLNRDIMWASGTKGNEYIFSDQESDSEPSDTCQSGEESDSEQSNTDQSGDESDSEPSDSDQSEDKLDAEHINSVRNAFRSRFPPLTIFGKSELHSKGTFKHAALSDAYNPKPKSCEFYYPSRSNRISDGENVPSTVAAKDSGGNKFESKQSCEKSTLDACNLDIKGFNSNTHEICNEKHDYMELTFMKRPKMSDLSHSELLAQINARKWEGNTGMNEANKSLPRNVSNTGKLQELTQSRNPNIPSDKNEQIAVGDVLDEVEAIQVRNNIISGQISQLCDTYCCIFKPYSRVCSIVVDLEANIRTAALMDPQAIFEATRLGPSIDLEEARLELCEEIRWMDAIEFEDLQHEIELYETKYLLLAKEATNNEEFMMLSDALFAMQDLEILMNIYRRYAISVMYKFEEEESALHSQSKE